MVIYSVQCYYILVNATLAQMHVPVIIIANYKQFVILHALVQSMQEA